MTGSSPKPQTVSIVTGGGRGIGRAIALRLSRLTAIIVVGRTLTDLQSVCAEIHDLGGAAAYVVGDVATASTASAAVELARQRDWQIANLVCNAGIAKGGPLVTFSAETWRRMFDVNVHGTFNFIQACLPAMIERKQGAISIISSTLGLKGAKNDTAYSATKFALVGLAQSLAAEVKKHNIVVVALCPGFVETDMTERTVAGLVKHKGVSTSEARKLIAATNPQGRILEAEEVAEAVAYISTTSPASDPALSGQAMDMTGAYEPRILQLINWVKEQAAPARKLYVPISGGSDSALAFYLCARAYPEKVLGIFVGAPENLRSRDWFEQIGPVSYQSIQAGNAEIQRWAAFLEMSNNSGAWLTGSRNRTENYTGLYSLASRVATFMPLANIWKSQVMELCDLIGVPKEVTASSRHADPDCGRPEEMAAISLEKIDAYLRRTNDESTEAVLAAYKMLTPAQIAYLERVVAQNKFKQSLPNQGPQIFAA